MEYVKGRTVEILQKSSPRFNRSGKIVTVREDFGSALIRFTTPTPNTDSFCEWYFLEHLKLT